MKKPNIFKLVLFLVIAILFTSLTFYPQALSQNFKLFTDGLDSFGGRAESDNFLLRIGSGGQPGVVGISEDDSFYALQGYVHTAAFVHGDVNADGNIDVVDVVYLINYLFKGGPAPCQQP